MSRNELICLRDVQKLSILLVDLNKCKNLSWSERNEKSMDPSILYGFDFILYSKIER
jgi:hypothetical protein